MKTILVPVDFSDVTLRVVKAAAQLAMPFHSRLVLMHVSESYSQGFAFGPGSEETPAGVTEPGPSGSFARQRLTELQDLVLAAGLESTSIELTGPPVDQIMSQAETARVDLIVLGTHGRSPLYHLFAGGVLDGILRRARCPVLVVPLAGAEHSKPVT
ncbi:MAG: universal stress protein [Verrucomicrobia bacterium]|nr:universal stress protein [Verrucomicrobiota bacterium]